MVTTVAGLPGSLNSGGADGTGQAARFNAPFDIAVDSSGALYVADQLNNTIRKGVFSSFEPALPAPFSPPAQTGQLMVALLPPEANGQWRLSTEVAWRDSGTTATGLQQGEYTVEFRDIPGYLAIPLSGPVAVTAGATTYPTNQDYSTFIPDDNSSGGSLTINIGPSPRRARVGVLAIRRLLPARLQHQFGRRELPYSIRAGERICHSGIPFCASSTGFRGRAFNHLSALVFAARECPSSRAGPGERDQRPDRLPLRLQRAIANGRRLRQRRGRSTNVVLTAAHSDF